MKNITGEYRQESAHYSDEYLAMSELKSSDKNEGDKSDDNTTSSSIVSITAHRRQPSHSTLNSSTT